MSEQAGPSPATPVVVSVLDAKATITACEQLAALLVDVVEAGAGVSFMAPLALDDARSFWRDIAGDVATGRAVVLVARRDGRIVGTVQLRPAGQPNQPHRADVAKMMVHTSARRLGIGARLMAALEHEALQLSRTLLVLDTTADGAARYLYEKLQWSRVGTIPGYALKPHGGLDDTIVYFKQLAQT